MSKIIAELLHLQVRIQSDADSVITRDENDNRMKNNAVPDGGDMVMVESAKSDSPSVELNVDETEEDDDNDDDGYREVQNYGPRYCTEMG